MQAFQSWKENCGKSRQNNPSCWCGIQSGRQTVKPQCAKSPQFLASDRSETSYSVHPSSSCAHPALFCQPRCTLSILFNNFDVFLALVSLLTWFMVCRGYLSNSYKEYSATIQISWIMFPKDYTTTKCLRMMCLYSYTTKLL